MTDVLKMKSEGSTHAFVQARITSSRLPGKILRKVHGESVLGHLINRLQLCQFLDGIAIATSTDPSDDPVFYFASDRGIPCHRGSLTDVASRLLGAAHSFDVLHIVRVSGDSPMVDPVIVDRAIEIYRNNEADIVTNVQHRTFPRGQSVEVFSVTVLAMALEKEMTDADREHVTPYFYRHPDNFRILNFAYTDNRPDAQLSVDTEIDLERFSRIMELLGPPYCRHRLESLLKAYDALNV